MQFLVGNTASVSFPVPVMIGGAEYTGLIFWSLGDGAGIAGEWVPVFPDTGAANAAVSAMIDPSNPQVLLLEKVADGVPFAIRAEYPGVAGPCSTTLREVSLIWSAPSVQLAPLCVVAE